MANDVFSVAQQLNADALVSLYTLDLSKLGGPAYYFTPGTMVAPVYPQVITNPCLAKTTTGWIKATSNDATLGAGSSIGAFAASSAWYLQGAGTGYLNYTGSLVGTDALAAQWSPGGVRTPCTAGLTYEFQALMQAHRCKADIRIQFYNSGGGVISDTAGTTLDNFISADGANEADYVRAHVRVVAPVGAVTMIGRFRMQVSATAGLTNPFTLFTKCQLGSVPADSIAPVEWQPYRVAGKPQFAGVIYEPVPMEAEGFEWAGRGPVARPKLRISNIGNLAGALAITFNDLMGAKLTRLRTFAKFLDGMSTADPGSYFEPDIWYFDRKATHEPTHIEWELSSIMDQEGRRLPARQMLRDSCTHTYRKAAGGVFDYTNITCPYVAATYFKVDGTSTGDPAQDVCGRRLSDCRLRFPLQALPTRAFPGMALDPR